MSRIETEIREAQMGVDVELSLYEARLLLTRLAVMHTPDDYLGPALQTFYARLKQQVDSIDRAMGVAR